MMAPCWNGWNIITLMTISLKRKVKKILILMRKDIDMGTKGATNATKSTTNTTNTTKRDIIIKSIMERASVRLTLRTTIFLELKLNA